MPFERARVEQDQQTASIDFNRTNDLAWANLGLALRYFLAGNLEGVLVGGEVQPTSPQSMAVVVTAPLAAIAQGGPVIVETDTPLSIQPADPTNPRIDLVSVGYSEQQTAQEQRYVRQGSTKVQVPINTKYQAQPELLVTTGVPAASPVPPAVPAGHIPLAEVTVPAGATSIGQGDIKRAASGLLAVSTPLKVATWQGSGNVETLPWVSADLVSLVVPSGRTGVIVAGINVVTVGSVDTSVVYDVLNVALEDRDSGAIIGQSEANLWRGERRDILVVGIVPGPTDGERTYRMRLRGDDGGTGAVQALSSIIVSATYDQGANVANPVVALTL